jgi:hypothetical protein
VQTQRTVRNEVGASSVIRPSILEITKQRGEIACLGGDGANGIQFHGTHIERVLADGFPARNDSERVTVRGGADAPYLDEHRTAGKIFNAICAGGICRRMPVEHGQPDVCADDRHLAAASRDVPAQCAHARTRRVHECSLIERPLECRNDGGRTHRNGHLGKGTFE